MRLISIFLLIVLRPVFPVVADELPDRSGVWQRVEGNGGIFDTSTVQPPDRRAGSPGVRQHPPLTKAWETKCEATLAMVAKDRVPDPMSICGTPAGGFMAARFADGKTLGNWN
jgi:hypothetical protein